MQRVQPMLRFLKDRAKKYPAVSILCGLALVLMITTVISSRHPGMHPERDEMAYAPGGAGNFPVVSNPAEVSGGNGSGFSMSARQDAEMAKTRSSGNLVRTKESKTAGDIFTPVAHAAAVEILKPQIIKRASLMLEVKDIRDSLVQVENLTIGHGGLVTNKQAGISGDNNQYRSGSLEVRVPQTQLDPFLSDLHALGIPRSETISSEDVGAEVVDLQSRIRNSQAQEKVLLGIMNRAGKIPEVLEVSNALANVRQEIEQMQGRLNYLRQQVAYSTVSIQLTEKELVSPTQGKPGFLTVTGNAGKRAFGDLIDFVNNLAALLVGLAVFWIPVLLILGVGSLLIWKLALERIVVTTMKKINAPAKTE